MIARLMCIGVVLAASSALAQTRPSPPPPGLSLTVYSLADPSTFDPRFRESDWDPSVQRARMPGYGVVRQVRTMDLGAGENTVTLDDIASGIDPTTVGLESLSGAGDIDVLEQNFAYDVMNSDKLVTKAVGHKVIITPPRADAVSGTLVGYDGSNYILRVSGGTGGLLVVPGYSMPPPLVQLAEPPAGLVIKPTLLWKVRAARPGPRQVRVTYQTDGLTWRADYGAVLDAQETAVDLSAWVTLLNESGMSYPDTRLKLIAGGVRRVTPPGQGGGGGGGLFVANIPAEPAFKERALFEYHLYTLAGVTSLPDNSTKQIELFPPRPDVPVEKTYTYCGIPAQVRKWDYQDQGVNDAPDLPSSTKVGVYLTIHNTQKAGLGIPLPAGRVRVYKRDDADGTQEFIGEDVIQHTPVDETLKVYLGDAFELVGQRTQTAFKIDSDERWLTESYHVSVRNHKHVAVTVRIQEVFFRAAGWEITQENAAHEKIDGHTVDWPVDIPADGEQGVTFTVKYTW